MARLIAVIADWEKGSEYLIEACKRASEELKMDVEVKKEDWDFLTKFGEKDEFGGVEVPQLFLETDEGEVKHIMTRVPLTSDGKPDLEAAKRRILEAVRA